MEAVLDLPEVGLPAHPERLRQHDLAGLEAGPVGGAREERRHREGRRPDAGTRIRDEQQHREYGQEDAEDSGAGRREPERRDDGAGEGGVHREPDRQDVVEERQELRVACEADRLVAERRRQRHDSVPVDCQLRPEGEVDGERERAEQEAPAGRPPGAAGVERDDREQRQADQRSLLGAVAREVLCEPLGPAGAGRLQMRRDDEVEQVGRVLGGRLEAGDPQVDERLVDERGGEDGGEEVGKRDRPEQGDERAAASRDEREAEQEGEPEHHRQGQRDLRRQVELEPEEQAELDDEAGALDASLECPHADEGDERDDEHRRELRLPEDVAELVAREAEEVAAEQRRPEPARQVAAEQEGREGRQGGQQCGGDVVGGDRPDERRQRREDDRDRRHRVRPDEVDTTRGPDEMRHERVLQVHDRMQPPAERPDRNLRVVEDADVLPARREQRPQPEVEEREQRVDREGDPRSPAAASND